MASVTHNVYYIHLKIDKGTKLISKGIILSLHVIKISKQTLTENN